MISASLLRGVAGALALVLSAPALPTAAATAQAAAAEPSGRCAAIKLAGAAKMARRSARCEARAVRRAEDVDADCLQTARARVDAAVAKAESKPGCVTLDDATTVTALVDMLIADLVAAVVVGEGPAARGCAKRKIKFAGRKAKDDLRCYARGARALDPPSMTCFETARDAYDAAFAEAELPGDCAAEGDGDRIDADIVAGVAEVVSVLSPVCGDSVTGPGQICDGSDDGACANGCAADCECFFAEVCGNALVEAGEECDDGSTADGDGCSSSCALEDARGLCAGIETVTGVQLAAELVSSGFDQPVHAASPPLDVARLFVVERAGRIRIVKDGVVLATPFLDIRSQVATRNERGLLSVAFHPSYATNGRFFVHYSNNDGDGVIARFEASAADPDLADPASEVELLVVEQFADNHNGGQIAFGPDGYLYIGFGDGGGQGDPQETGQDPDRLLGKMLRMDVDVETPPFFAVPADNPDAVRGYPFGLVWASGLRNPWRFSFDRLGGDLYIADVGQFEVEEVNVQAGGSAGGENYGWDVFEGSQCFEPTPPAEVCPNPADGFTFPVLEYDHGEGCSITGGFVYRGCRMPDLAGAYFYADLCTNFVRTFVLADGVEASFRDVTDQVGATTTITSFAEDARGELYLMGFGGSLFRIVPEP